MNGDGNEKLLALLGTLSSWAEDPEYQRQAEAFAKEQAETEKRRSQESRIQTLVDRGIPSIFIQQIVCGPVDLSPALAHAQDFRDNPEKRVLVLAGSVGVGKTMAAAWLVAQGWSEESQKCFQRPDQPFFTTAEEINRSSNFDAEYNRKLERAFILAIDDLGVEYSDDKGFWRSRLDALFNRRHSNGLRTVITTNHNAATFKAAHGERIADRIRQFGTFREMSGPSMRRAAE